MERLNLLDMMTILILISLGSVIAVVSKIVGMQSCPEENQLKSVVNGRVSKNSRIAEKVIRHLGVCKKCQQKVRDWNTY